MAEVKHDKGRWEPSGGKGHCRDGVPGDRREPAGIDKEGPPPILGLQQEYILPPRRL